MKLCVFRILIISLTLYLPASQTMRLLLSGLLILLSLSCLPGQNKYKSLRDEMVKSQIEARGINNWRVLNAMKKVPRHEFVPQEYIKYAYSDGALPIGFGQTISQPFIVASMTEMINPEPGYRVLEIGTGSGYQAAVLAEIVKKVYTIELVPELGELASQRLKDLGYENIETKVGDGFYGWESQAPFDAIVVTAAPEIIPDPLIQQLKDGGLLVIPVGAQSELQYLKLVRKKGKKIEAKNIMPVRFVPFIHQDDN